MRMRLLLSPRPALFRACHSLKSTPIMSGNNKQNKGQNKPKPKNPPLTHFLCLPLVNSVSLPQLESSLASFKASIPPNFPSKPEQREQQQSPLIPDAAIRPVGTFHLTLGVMSLSSPERLEEALQFFHSLDLAALLRTSTENAAQKRLRASARKGGPTFSESTEYSGNQEKLANKTVVSTDQFLATGSAEELLGDESATPKPFTISLESLHVLPRARAATVLHAAPVDPTSRLYPFCEALRDKFLEAGLLQGEYKTERKKTPKNQKSERQNTQQNKSAQDRAGFATATSTHKPAGEEPTSLEGIPTELAKETAQQSNAATAPSQPATSDRKSKPKIRPLLLHATVVNTIYIRGRKQKPGAQGKRAHNDRYTFDARDVLSHYKNFYLDSERTVPRSNDGAITHRKSEITGNGNDEPNVQESPAEKKNADAQSGNEETTLTQLPSNDAKDTGYPFVWARNFPIEAVCICEMGAKKLDPNADDSGLNARLGEKYTVVAERALNFGALEQRIERNSIDESNNGSVECGVKITA